MAQGETEGPHARGVARQLENAEDAHELDDLEDLADLADPCHGLEVVLRADVLGVAEGLEDKLDEVRHDGHQVNKVQRAPQEVSHVAGGQQPQEVLGGEEEDGEDLYALEVRLAVHRLALQFLDRVERHGHDGDEHEEAGEDGEGLGGEGRVRILHQVPEGLAHAAQEHGFEAVLVDMVLDLSHELALHLRVGVGGDIAKMS